MSRPFRAMLPRLALPALLVCAGCYERVVRDDGPRKKGEMVYESNLDSSRVPVIDDALDALLGTNEPAPAKKPVMRAPRTRTGNQP